MANLTNLYISNWRNKIFLLLLIVPGMMAFVNFQSASLALKKIKKTVNLITGTVSEYYYNSDGTLASVQSSKGSKATYRYESGMVIRHFYDSLIQQNTFDTFFIDQKGRAANRETRLDAYSTSAAKFEFDADNRLMSESFYSNGALAFSNKKIISDGNEISLTQSDKDGIRQTIYYRYATKLNTIGNENMGMDFMGRSPKNLLRESVSVSSKGDTTSHLTYRYRVDAAGIVILKVGYRKAGGLVDSTSYSYY